ncbi:MAG: hypothetical protein IPM13_09045 [Phycisphaerales bacterium]|nr:hypothetical protein [Phycisphaerales bacterium]
MNAESLDSVIRDVTVRIEYFERTHGLRHALSTDDAYLDMALHLRQCGSLSRAEYPLDRYVFFLVMRRAVSVQYKPDDDEPRLPSEYWWFLASHLNCEEVMQTAALNQVNAELKAQYLSWPLEDRRLVLRFVRAARQLSVVERWLAPTWTHVAATWEALAR